MTGDKTWRAWEERKVPSFLLWLRLCFIKKDMKKVQKSLMKRRSNTTRQESKLLKNLRCWSCRGEGDC